MKVLEEALRLTRDGRSCAMATLVQTSGSSPQKAGAKMLVRDDGTVAGTLGGGCLEAEVIQVGLSAIRDGRPQTISIELTERAGGLVCGGKVQVFVEPMAPEPELMILGAGHVGKALARLARFAGFRVCVVDDREEYLQGSEFGDALKYTVASFTDPFHNRGVSRNTYVVVATRGHLHDYAALKAALSTEARYIGLLGSRRKRALLFKRLLEDGLPDETIQRVITPVGLPIGAKTPEEIAVSITAQLIEERRKDEISGFSHSCGGGAVHEDGTVKAAAAGPG